MRLVDVVRDAHLVTEHEGDLDNAGETSSHKGVAKGGVGHGASHQCLRVGRHGPASKKDDEAGNEVPLGSTFPVSAEPDASQAGAPPYYPHGGVLPVVLHPGGTPSVLSEGVDAAPGSDDDAVEELRGAARPLDPSLADQQSDGQQDAIGDEGAAHDEVGRTLAQVVALTEALGGDSSKYHLRPANDGEGLAVDAVDSANDGSYALVDAPLEVQPEVDAEKELDYQLKVEPVGELGVDVVGHESPAAVHVAEGEADEGDDGG